MRLYRIEDNEIPNFITYVVADSMKEAVDYYTDTKEEDDDVVDIKHVDLVNDPSGNDYNVMVIQNA